MKTDTGIILRVSISALLAIGVLGLFLLQRPKASQQSGITAPHEDWKSSLPIIDREIDTILAHYGIERTWLKKKAFPIPEAGFSRIERRIEIPLDIVPVQMNQTVNGMARRFKASAIASENSKEHLVTIHIELNGYVIQTLVLHPNPLSKRRELIGGQQVRT